MDAINAANARHAAELKALPKFIQSHPAPVVAGGGVTPGRRKTPSGSTPIRGQESPVLGSKTTTSHLAKLTPKQIIIKERKATDFFGRVIEVAYKLYKKPRIYEDQS